MLKIKNIYILKYGLIIAVFSFLINIIVYFQYAIDDIIFLEHIYFNMVEDGSKLDIYYIKDASDNRRITSISFPEKPQEFSFIVLDDPITSSQEHAHYNYNKIKLTIYIPKYLDKTENKITLTKAIVKFDNGTEQEFSLGNITLFKNVDFLNYFNTIDTRGDDLYYTTKVARQDSTIKFIGNEYYEELSDIVHMKINNISAEELIFPFKINKGGKLTIESQLDISENDSRRYNVYNIDNYINFEASDSIDGYEYLHNISYAPFDYLSPEREIVNFLKYKGVK